MLNKQFDIHRIAHITGEACTKLKDLLGGADILLTKKHRLRPQPIFLELHERGVCDQEMYKTFNIESMFSNKEIEF